ncbi:MAG: tripartite tricarboxylate transporter substrate binding protein [Desulfovibrio sp.]
MLRKSLWMLLCLTITLLSVGTALADYPKKPITLVAPYSAGGASDLAARALASVAPNYLAQQVMVVNKPGASGITGSAFVAKSKADGYTLLLSRVGGNCLVPAMNAHTPFTWDDFTFLGLLEINPYVFVVRDDSPYRSLNDLVAAIEQNPGKLSFSSNGPFGLLAIGPKMLMDVAGLSPYAANDVPYNGGGDAKVALLGGHVDFLGVNLSAVIDQIKAGQMRALAVTTSERLDSLPDVPTVAEAGYPKLEILLGWSGLWGPKDLPESVTSAWINALQQIKEDAQWNKLTHSLGSIPRILSPEETKTFVRDQFETYRAFGEKLRQSSN